MKEWTWNPYGIQTAIDDNRWNARGKEETVHAKGLQIWDKEKVAVIKENKESTTISGIWNCKWKAQKTFTEDKEILQCIY